MKKLFAVIAVAMMLFFTSCMNNNVDNTKRTDNPSDELKTIFKLDSVNSGAAINEYDANASEYYIIKTAEDKKASLFVYSTPIKETVKNIKTDIDYLTVNLLRFESTITQDEVNAVKSNFYKEEILKPATFGIEALNANAPMYNVTISKEIVDDIKTNDQAYSLKTIYVPTQVTHVRSNTTVLEVYVMLPLYAEIVKDTNSKFEGITDLTTTIAFENSYIVKA